MTEMSYFDINSADGLALVQGSRPVGRQRNGKYEIVTNSAGFPMVRTNRGLQVNSVLRKDEWEELDAAVIRAATLRLNAVGHLAERGLVKTLGSLGTTVSQWNTSSEMTRAAVTIEGYSRGSRDRLDFELNSVPVPVIHKEYDFGTRELEASRRMGNALETGHAEAAARVVAEELERMLIGGNTNIVIGGSTIYGYTTHPDRNTGSGSDWGTAVNVLSTVDAMITALQGDGHYGPYALYAATTQYNQARNLFFTDGAGDTPYDRVLKMGGITGFYPSDWITAGQCVLVQMDTETVDLAFVPGYGFNWANETERKVQITGVTNLEWVSGDGMQNFFKSLCVAVPRVKSKYDGKCGIAHYSSI